MICYNIGSPLLKAYLRSDMQRNMPDFDEAYEKFDELNDSLKKLRTTSINAEELFRSRNSLLKKVDEKNEIDK